MRVGVRKVWIVVAGLLLAGLAVTLLFRDSRYRRHLVAAQQALAARDFTAAGRHLDECLAARPRDLPTRLLAAQAARRRGDTRGALAHLRAYKAGGGSAEAVELEQRLLRVQQGDLAEAGMLLAFCEQHPGAPETPLVLEAVIEGSLKNPEEILSEGDSVRFGKGGKEFYLTQVPRALEQWLRTCPAAPDQVQGLVWRGRLHHVLDEHAQALADLREALARDPDHFQARLYLATVLVQEAPEEALAHLRMLRQRRPENHLVRYGLASILRALGHLEEARQALDEMLAENPDDVSALVERGLLDVDLQRPKDAERRLRWALALAPNLSKTNLALSRSLHRMGKTTEAKRFFDRFQQIEAGQSQQTTGPTGH